MLKTIFQWRKVKRLRAICNENSRVMHAQRAIFDDRKVQVPALNRRYRELLKKVSPAELEKRPKGQAVRVYSSLRPMELDTVREALEEATRARDAALIAFNEAAVAFDNAADELKRLGSYWRFAKADRLAVPKFED